jgi:hypothetical protein
LFKKFLQLGFHLRIRRLVGDNGPLFCVNVDGVDTTMINLVLEGYYIPSHTCIHIGFTVVFFAASVFQHCKSRAFIKHPLLIIRSNECFAFDKP